jgi:hypothetical protein
MKNFIFLFSLCWLVITTSFVSANEYIHSFSGTVFPDKIANFSFKFTKEYDETGKDISVAYGLNKIIELTQYIYPANGQDLNKHFESYKKTIFSVKNNAKLILSEDIKTNNLTGKKAKFEYFEDFHSKNQKVYSYLYIYKSKGWFIKLRITATTDDNTSNEKEIDAYLLEMPFPIKESK